MKFKTSRLIVVALLVAVAGCSSKGGSKDDASIEDRSTDSDGAVASGAAGGIDFSSEALNDPNSPLSQRVIYFEYNSAEIAYESQETLVNHAGFLNANPDHHLTLEGNTDERGSREYNIALGDQRALSVQRVLELNGVSSGQITVVSYGEEKPAAEGQSEAAWRLNRRVELVY